MVRRGSFFQSNPIQSTYNRRRTECYEALQRVAAAYAPSMPSYIYNKYKISETPVYAHPLVCYHIYVEGMVTSSYQDFST